MSKIILTAPKQIYLNVSDGDYSYEDEFPINHEGITWCEESVLDVEVRYIRADIAESTLAMLRAEIIELQTKLDNMMEE